MSLYNGPPRPGARGGRDQFSWDNVKADKDREYYLGHSVKALAGRWQKGRDVYWYTREKGAQDTIQDEIQAVKQREEELMMEALGLKPKTVVKPAPQLDKHDIDELIKGKQDEQEQPDEAGAAAQQADRIQGLGYIAGAGGGLAEGAHTTLPGVGSAGPGPQAQRLPPPPPLTAAAAAGGRPGAAAALASGMTAAQLKELQRAEKRARKEAKKEAKRAKKEAKRAKKARQGSGADKEKEKERERKRRRRRSASSSSSSGNSDGSSIDSDGGGGRRQQNRAAAARPERRPFDKASHQTTRGAERDREQAKEEDRAGMRERERAHERADPARGAGRHLDHHRHHGDGDDFGRPLARTRVRHDSPSRSPQPRRGASPPRNGQQEQPQRRRRHDSPIPSPARGRRLSRSRSRSPPDERRRQDPDPRVGTRTAQASWGRQGRHEEGTARGGGSRDGRDRRGDGAGSAGGQERWREDQGGHGDRARSRSPRGRRHDSRSPGAWRREDRSRSLVDRRGGRADDGRGDARASVGGEETAAARERQRDRRHDSRSRSPDRGRIRGR